MDGERLEQRIVEAAAVLPGYGGVTGWAALAWWGGVWFTGHPWSRPGPVAPVVLATPSHAVRSQPGCGFIVSEERLNPADLTVHNELPITTPVRSLAFEMRYAPTDWLAVVALDMAAYDDLVSLDEAGDWAAAHNGWTGIPRMRLALTLADENSWSPPETLMRMHWRRLVDGVRLRCNAAVLDPDGRLIGTPDLIDPATGVVGEYDGAVHLEGEQRLRDVDRAARFRAHGLEPVTRMAGDLRRPAAFADRLLTAYRLAAEIPLRRRRWTLDPGPGWIDTSTVAARRALSEPERERLLRYRAA
ncbi:hypothetical protein [Nocardioides sp. SYSU D00038]|uniref:hypothetical protein n=1 Tax=Nocardioides sp. SYSU D00038 TaxID=2812554 RepID=UPI0019680070|nr:hypothetical protein [Nocardioides sp. SYSU D00038]